MLNVVINLHTPHYKLIDFHEKDSIGYSKLIKKTFWHHLGVIGQIADAIHTELRRCCNILNNYSTTVLTRAFIDRHLHRKKNYYLNIHVMSNNEKLTGSPALSFASCSLVIVYGIWWLSYGWSSPAWLCGLDLDPASLMPRHRSTKSTFNSNVISLVVLRCVGELRYNESYIQMTHAKYIAISMDQNNSASNAQLCYMYAAIFFECIEPSNACTHQLLAAMRGNQNIKIHQ